MPQFNAPEFEKDVLKALKTWLETLDRKLSDLTEDISDIVDNHIVLPNSNDDDDGEITSDHTLCVFLPECDGIELTYQEFIDYSLEMKSAKLRNNFECTTSKRYLCRIRPSNQEAYHFFYNAIPESETEEDLLLQQEYVEAERQLDEIKSKVPDNWGSVNEDEREKYQAIMVEFRNALDKRNILRSQMKRPVERFCSTMLSIEGANVRCSLTKGLTMFNILVAAQHEFDEYFPPLVEDDFFIELTFNQSISESTIANIVEAYLFEMSSSLLMDFEFFPRPDLHEDTSEPKMDELDSISIRTRPLLIGKGMNELLTLYNRATTAADNDIRVLYFTKAVEYVSQTVVRLQFTDAVRAKLLSPRALNPDSEYISELTSVIEEQRIFSKDREAIKLTIITCCDPTELTNVAPNFLKEIRNITQDSKKKDRDDALGKLGLSLVATRNAIAHAKANYQPTGEECPSTEMDKFVHCIKIAVQQIIRWYHSRPEIVRVM